MTSPQPKTKQFLVRMTSTEREQLRQLTQHLASPSDAETLRTLIAHAHKQLTRRQHPDQEK